MSKLNRLLRRWWWILLLITLLGSYWLLPISGQVLVNAGPLPHLFWPQIAIFPDEPKPGDTVTVNITDNNSWAHVALTVEGQTAHFDHWQKTPGFNVWTWIWTFTMPAAIDGRAATEAVFYTKCHTGCQTRAQFSLATVKPTTEEPSDIRPMQDSLTKLCVVLPDPKRNWHGRSGWVVDITYAKLADSQEDPYWNIDELAWRVHLAKVKGLRVLVRVDYAKGQTLPPADDFLALTDYLTHLRRLATDERLKSVYGFIIGSGPNAQGSNSLAPDRPITPAWYAQVFSGYNEAPAHTENVVQTIRSVNATTRILVGPVRPWLKDQNGDLVYAINVPWLNYMNTLVTLLDQTARIKAKAGFPFVAPDGFALHVPGRPDARELAGKPAADEPKLDLLRVEWQQAQAGFGVYKDWLKIINAYPTTRGLPVFISSTNTAVPDGGAPPAQNYPAGWLTNAFAVINQEPQVQSLCWFMDLVPGDNHWDEFSLTRHPGRMIDAAEEFDRLLQP